MKVLITPIPPSYIYVHVGTYQLCSASTSCSICVYIYLTAVIIPLYIGLYNRVELYIAFFFLFIWHIGKYLIMKESRLHKNQCRVRDGKHVPLSAIVTFALSSSNSFFSSDGTAGATLSKKPNLSIFP